MPVRRQPRIVRRRDRRPADGRHDRDEMLSEASVFTRRKGARRSTR